MQPRDISRALFWVLPNCSAKRRLLRWVGHDVHPTAIVRSSLVWKVERLSVGAGARIGKFNVIKNLRTLSLADGCSIGRMNLISAHPVYGRLYESASALTMHEHASITSRHSIDCSGPLTIGAFAGLFGHRTTVMSHSIDVARDAQQAQPISIGPRSFVGTNCILLGGGRLPGESVLAAGSVLTRSKENGQSGLWAGVPAKRIGDAGGAWFDRSGTHTRRVYDPSAGTITEDAF